MGYSIFCLAIMILLSLLILIPKFRKEEDMNTQALTDAVSKLTAAIQALPAQLAAQNAQTQAAIDTATTAINAAATAVEALVPAPSTPTN